MLKKIIIPATLLCASFTTVAADLSESCVTYFDELNSYFESAPKDSATQAQIEALKQQLDTSKTQLTALPKEQQEAGCKQGLQMWEQMKASLPK